MDFNMNNFWTYRAHEFRDKFREDQQIQQASRRYKQAQRAQKIIARLNRQSKFQTTATTIKKSLVSDLYENA